MPEREFTQKDRQKLAFAAEIVSSFFPYLGGIFGKLDIRFDDRVGTAGVTESGKLLIDPDFFDALKPGVETAFLLAHEMLHLAQMIFERGKAFSDRESLNIAHDFLINELLCDTMQIANPPLGGLDWRSFWWSFSQTVPSLSGEASVYSLEEMVRIVTEIKNTAKSKEFRRSWWFDPAQGRTADTAEEGFSNNPFEDLFEAPSPAPAPAPAPAERKKPNKPKGEKIRLDLIPAEMEESLFPGEDRKSLEKSRNELLEICREAAVRNVILTSVNCGQGQGTMGGNYSQAVDIVRSCYTPPWQMVMQRWCDGAAVPKRSWARASRRGAWRSDIVLPGREQERYTIHIVLDTSGSMVGAIPSILGQISSFARNSGMAQAHIMQCDTEVTADDVVDIDRMEKYRISGYGGSNMSPAMLKLAEDPEVTSVLVITDGFISYPPSEKIPYEVLWCLPEYSPVELPYGNVVHIPIS